MIHPKRTLAVRAKKLAPLRNLGMERPLMRRQRFPDGLVLRRDRNAIAA